MTDHPQDEPTQETPKGESIPVPSRKVVLRDLEKVAKPSPREGNGVAEQ